MTVRDVETWSTPRRDTCERTCGLTIPPVFSVTHDFSVARDPDPMAVTVTRTYEATVEWTSRLDLPAWLSAVADVLTPYEPDRFGSAPESNGGWNTKPDVTAGGAARDGRFLAAPVEATIRPDGGDPVRSDPYHYWNAPLARLQTDPHYPGGVDAMSIDLVEGPEALWSGTSMAGGIRPKELPDAADTYCRVGVAIIARERFHRSATQGGADGDVVPPSVRSPPSERWGLVGDPSPPDCSWLHSFVDATLAPEVRSLAFDRRDATDAAASVDPVSAAVRAVERRIDAAWTAFRRRDGSIGDAGGDGTGDSTASDDRESCSGTGVTDPYQVPDAAVRVATAPDADGEE